MFAAPVLIAPVSNASRLFAVVNCELESPPGKFAVLLASGERFVVVLNFTVYCGTIPASLKFRILTKRAVVPNLKT